MGQNTKGDDVNMPRTDTCLAVVRALDALMKTDSIERIRVTELCREAGVARATFYENFQDIFAVATWMWDHLMQSTLYQAGVTLNAYDAHLRKFETLLDHRDFFKNAMRPVDHASICQHGGRMMLSHMVEVCEGKLGRGLTREEYLSLEFFSTGAKHMTRHWVEDGMVDPPELMARLFVANIPEFARQLLEV